MSMLICPVTGVYLCLVASSVSRAICALRVLWTQELRSDCPAGRGSSHSTISSRILRYLIRITLLLACIIWMHR